MDDVRLYIQANGGDIRPLDIPAQIVRALINMPKKPKIPYRNIPECAKQRVYECLMRSGTSMTYKQLMKKTGYSLPYLYSVVGGLLYERKVIGERCGERHSRISAIPRTRKIRKTDRKQMYRNMSVYDLEGIVDGLDDFQLRISRKAAMNVLRMVMKHRKPISEESMRDTNIYSHRYLRTILNILVSKGYLEAILRKGQRYYRPSPKATKVVSVF